MLNFRQILILIKKIKLIKKKESPYKILEEYKMNLEIKQHMIRVSDYTEILADLMCLNKLEIEEIKKGALLHDIGKQGIPDEPLNKFTKLDKEEFEKVKKHTQFGLKILNNKKYAKTRIENVILLHHEKWNGEGYPFGLKGKLIPIEARIVSVTNYYDTLTSKRAHKKSFSHEKAMAILINESGKSFDPDIISMFELFQNKFETKLKEYR
ncbi:HD-GYP domain-containing protein [Cetobacterium somerae]